MATATVAKVGKELIIWGAIQIQIHEPMHCTKPTQKNKQRD